MSGESMKTLKNKLKGHRTYFGTLLKRVLPQIEGSLEDINVSKFKSELNYLESRLETMDTLFNVILEHPDVSAKMVEDYTEFVLGAKETIQRGLDKVTEISGNASHHLNSTHISNHSVASITKDILSHANLPKLELPLFYGGDGCWREYRSFMEMFNAMVDSEVELSDTLKVQYLRRSLKGEAENLISHLDPVAANYNLYLKTLRDAYKVGQEEINHIVGKLMDITHWSKCTSSKDLFRLFTHVKQYYYLLDQAKPDRTEDIFIVRAMIGLLPDRLGYKLIDQVPVEDRTVERVLEWIQRDINAQKEGKSYGLGKGATGGSTNGRFQGKGRKAMSVQRSMPPCFYCNEEGHSPHYCPSHTSPQDNYSFIMRSSRCFNCLGPHRVSDCTESSRCSKCSDKRPHSPSICGSKSSSNTNKGGWKGKGKGKKQSAPQQSTAQPSGDSHHSTGDHAEGGIGALSPHAEPFRGKKALYCSSAPDEVFYQTALVTVRSKSSGKSRKSRIILDTACHDSYILTTVAQELECAQVRSQNIQVEVFGTDVVVEGKSGLVELEIIDKEGKVIPLSLFTMDRLTGSIPGCQVSSKVVEQLRGFNLADGEAVRAGDLPIHILIGLNHYWDIVNHTVEKTSFGPRLLDTRVGWVISGSTHTSVPRPHPIRCGVYYTSRQSSLGIETGESLEDILYKFWDLDSMGVKAEEVSPVIDHFDKTVRFDEEQKRVEVKIPWRKHMMPYLPTNYRQSLLRLNVLQKRFALSKNEKLKEKYEETLQKHLDEKVIELVQGESNTTFINGKVGDIDYNNSVIGTSDDQHRVLHYIPHQCVTKKGSEKVRIVFDASSKAYPGALSLNQCIHPGPNLLTDLGEALMRWRIHWVALVGDIKGAFHTISLSETDRDAFRFLGYVQGRLQEYRFRRVPFGCTVSPFLLNSTVRSHFKKVLGDRPELYDLVISSLYVDDFLGGGKSVQVVCELKELLQEILAEISMEWHDWQSNSKQVREHIQQTEVGVQKVLGLDWHPLNDTIKVKLEALLDPNVEMVSKRDMLSLFSSLFDPLGLFSPILLTPKLMFQKVCKSKCGWKGKLSAEMRDTMLEWKSQLQCLEEVALPRCVLPEEYDTLELHGFSDASLQSYGAVIYFRTIGKSGIDCNFVISRNRVAPLKGHTLQRLELLGAVLLSRLVAKVLETHKSLKFAKVVLYCDSKDVLYWIKSLNNRWSVFVENRVNEIHRLTLTTMWRHVAGVLNPADILTRPITAEALVKNKVWFKAPDFLYTNEAGSDLKEEELQPTAAGLGEMKKSANVVSNSAPTKPTYLINIDKIGSYTKLINITVYVLMLVLRVVDKFKDKVKYDYSNLSMAATKYWVRLEQQAYYPREVEHCPVGKYVHKVGPNSTNAMRSMRLFKDEEGLLRLSSRVQDDFSPWETRNPILLPGQSRFVKLYIEFIHIISLHAGSRVTLNNIRKQFWIPRGRQLVKLVRKHCVTCKKQEGKFYPSTSSPPLPDFRVTPSPPFDKTGVDFAGPFYLKEGKQVKKAYVMVMTCAVTRAVALELIPGISVEQMTFGFRRFCARMATVPSLVVSDNAATFKRARKELEEIFSSPKMEKYLNGRRIKWQFYLERCPWWGGFIERMVQTMKRSIKKVIGNSRLSYIEFSTILYEIEGLINARPITWLYNDLEEGSPISPSDLLHGRPYVQFPPLHEVKVEGKLPQMCRGRLRYMEKLKSAWWSRWQKEYLAELRQTHAAAKVSNMSKIISPGDVVLVRNENLPRGSWKLGKVTGVTAGKDNQIRTAHVEIVKAGKKGSAADKKYKKKELNRSPTHLVPLEINDREDSSTEVVHT